MNNPANSVEWCSLCNSKPADGRLKMLDTISNKVVTVPACTDCVIRIPLEDWIDEKEAPC
jgi:hypothetical protein